MAKGRGLEARLSSPKLIETTPGKIVTASFLVANQTGRDEELTDQLVLPPGWQPIAPADPQFTLRAGAQQIRLVAFFVPANAPSGRFDVAYAARSRRDYDLTDRDSFSVNVLPVAKLELLVEEAPRTVIAGEDYEVALRVINRGNSQATVRLEFKTSPEYPVRADATQAVLAAGASQPCRVSVPTDKTLKKRLTQILSVKAVALQTATVATQDVAVEIIPPVTGERDPWHRLPTRLRFIAAKDTGKDFGFQAEYSGAGSLDEEGKRKVDFLFRGPDLEKTSLFGLHDEYRLSYFEKNFDAHLGDRSYSLSPLTERNAYGRGAELDIHPGPTGAGAFYMESRWRVPEFAEVGAYLQHDFTPEFGLKGNFLHRTGAGQSLLTNSVPADIYTLESKWSVGRFLKLCLEGGFSDSASDTDAARYGYRVEARGEPLTGVNYSLEKVYAGPGFFGYYHDSDSTHAAVTFPIYHKLRGQFSFQQYDNNLDLETGHGSIANRETFYRPGLRYTFPFGTDLTLEYQGLRRRDALLPADYDFQEHSARLGLGHSFGKLSLQTFVERGVLEDSLKNDSHPVERYSVFAYYRPTPRQSYSLFASTGHTLFSASPDRTQTFGGSAQWNIKPALAVNVSYARNIFDLDTNRHADSAYATVRYTFPNQHNVALTGRWTNNDTLKRDETAVQLAYTIPLGLPVGRKKSVGIVKGRVYDADDADKRPLRRVVLTANGSTAVTDNKGEFIFPSLEPGTHLLRVEQNSIGVDRVTTVPLPLTVEVRHGMETTVPIGVTTAASISATLAVFAPANRNVTTDANPSAQDTFQEVARLESASVEITNGIETFRQTTDRHGTVSFDHLRPGQWTLVARADNLPAHHYLETAQAQFALQPGDKRAATLRVLPRHRPIQLIDQGVIH